MAFDGTFRAGCIGCRIPKTLCSNDDIRRIKKQLTFTPKQQYRMPGQPPPPSFSVYHEDDEAIYAPRFWFSWNFPSSTIKFQMSGVKTFEATFQGTLRDDLKQPEAANIVLRVLREEGGGILCLPCGYGKTTVSTFVISNMGLRTLVVVHKACLMEQWKERVGQFLPLARVGILRQDTLELKDTDVVIAMLQTLAARTFPPGTFSSFGLVVVDECHRVGTPVLSKALNKIGRPYMLGLTATPDRKDGLLQVIENYLGRICFQIDRKEQTFVSVRRVFYETEHYRSPPKTYRNGCIAIADMITKITEDEDRNAVLEQHLRTFARQERKVLILGERITHLRNLFARSTSFAVSGMYVGGMKEIDLDNSKRAQLIFASYSMASEGLDIPSLDTLVLATPRSDIVQCAGRILRESGMTKRHLPLILDVVDRWSIFMGQCRKRTGYYRSAGFSIEECEEEAEEDVNGDDNECMIAD